MRIIFLSIMVLAATSLVIRDGVLTQQPYLAGLLPKADILADYDLMSYSDLSDPDFIGYYNNHGLDYVMSYPGLPCCVISVQEGYLTYGDSNNFTYVESFQNGEDCCTTGTMPNGTVFGGGPVNGQYEGYEIKKLDTKSLALLQVTSTSPSKFPNGEACTGKPTNEQQFTAIFKRKSMGKPYIVQPTGPNYPAPSGYVRMSLDDVTSTDFASYYNSNGIYLQGAHSNSYNYCCMIRLANDAWLTYGPNTTGGFSPISLYRDQHWSCADSAMGNRLELGGAFGGPYAGTMIPTITSAEEAKFGAFYKNNNNQDWDGCEGILYNDSLVLYKLG